MRALPIALFVLFSLVLSTSMPHADDAKENWTRCKHAKYKATQIGDLVVVVAYGSHNTSGYKTKLRQLPIEIYPTQFECVEQKPGGITLQVITPFAEIAHFKASGTIKALAVHDGNGKHTVKVEQSKKK